MSTRDCSQASPVIQDASSRGTPRKPLRIRFILKQRQSNRKTGEEVHASENASGEETSEETSCSCFKGLPPCWSVTGRRGRKAKQSAQDSTNLDPRLDNEAASGTRTHNNTNRMEVASSIGDVETETWTSLRAKGKNITIPVSDVETSTRFVNSAHFHGNMASSSTEEDGKSSSKLELRSPYEVTPLRLAVNKAKGKSIVSPISVSKISTWSENPNQSVSGLATDDENGNIACSSTKANKRIKTSGTGGVRQQLKNTSQGSISTVDCNFCSNSFSTPQALGCHMAIHKKRKSIAVEDAQVEGCRRNNAVQECHDKEPNKPHKCSVCSKAFETGQKLGGHMRAHYDGVSSSKRLKRDAHTGSSPAAAREEVPGVSSSASVNEVVAPAAADSLSEVTTMKNTPAAAAASSAVGSVTKEMALLLHYFDLNELPRERDTPASTPSSKDTTTTAASALDLTLSL